MLHQIRKILHDLAVFAPIWENAMIRGDGPRVQEGALTLTPSYPLLAGRRAELRP